MGAVVSANPALIHDLDMEKCEVEDTEFESDFELRIRGIWGCGISISLLKNSICLNPEGKSCVENIKINFRKVRCDGHRRLL